MYVVFKSGWLPTRGKPDDQSVDFSTRISGINEIIDVTTKPLIFDADNGGRVEHIHFTVKTLERLGVSAIIIEDKVGLKQNSLFSDQKSWTGLNPRVFEQN